MNKSNQPAPSHTEDGLSDEQRPNVLHRIGAFFALRDDDEDEEIPVDPPRRNVVAFESSRESARRSGAEVCLFAPRTFSEVTEIADSLRRRQVVIVNLQTVDRSLLQRIVDFVSGTTYVLDGRMQKLADGIYLIVPTGVAVNAAGLREQLVTDPTFDFLSK